MKTVEVSTQRSYTVVITNGWEKLSADFCRGEKICVVTDSNVAPLYLDAVLSRFGGKKLYTHVIPAGERSKSAASYLALVSFLAENTFSRKDCVVALGGGVVGDLAGFAAATYMRGIDCFQLPTTLLAMIDSSVGGKTAIDLPQGKNLVGAFAQPVGVYVNLDVLDTLPPVERENGMGELVKYAFLSRAVAEKLPQGISQELVALCVGLKAQIVAEDERDNGKRMLLNLGHTVGHAIELLSDFQLPHGLCVAKGLSVALEASQKHYGIAKDKFALLKRLLVDTGLDLSINFEKQDLISATVHDKKAANGAIDFVFVADIGDCRVEKISQEELAKLL